MKISEILTKLKDGPRSTDKNRCKKWGHCYGLAYDNIFRSFDRKELLFDEATGIFEIAANPEDYRTETRKPLTDYSNNYIQTTLFSWSNYFYFKVQTRVFIKELKEKGVWRS